MLHWNFNRQHPENQVKFQFQRQYQKKKKIFRKTKKETEHNKPKKSGQKYFEAQFSA